MTSQPQRWTVLSVVSVLIAAGIAAGVAGYVFDGAGRMVFGFWAVVWGVGVALTGLGLITVVRSGGVARRVGAVVIAVACGLPGLLVLLFAASYRTPLLTAQGLWMWPLGLVLMVIATFALRTAVTRSRPH